MFEINIDPLAFEIGSLSLYWSLIFFILAGVIALGFFYYRSLCLGLPRDHTIALCLSFILFGLVLSRSISVIEDLLYYGEAGAFWSSGLRAHGLLIGATGAVWIYSRIAKRSFTAIADAGLPALILFFAIYRMGCVIAGCCYGLPTDLPWAVTYVNLNALAPLNISIHPTQLYHLVWNVIIFLFALLLHRKLRTPGLTAQIVLITYFAGDIAIRLFRGDEPRFAGISLSQMIAAGIIIAALLPVFYSPEMKKRNTC